MAKVLTVKTKHHRLKSYSKLSDKLNKQAEVTQGLGKYVGITSKTPGVC
jgi:hypothetical protein